MAKVKQKKAKVEKEEVVVLPKFNPLIVTNYKPLPRFRSGCINCK